MRLTDAATVRSLAFRSATTQEGEVPISIIVPALNEEPNLAATLASCHAEGVCEVIVVDGGSSDGSIGLAESLGAQVVQAGRGRALQMNAGAAFAVGDVLLFLHADTRLPAAFDRAIADAMADPSVVGGRFDIDLQPSTPLIWLTARLISLRSRLSKLGTGDQAIFVRAAYFRTIGGFEEIPIMEDLALSVAMKRAGKVACLRQRVVSSSRRWKKDGIIRTILLMWSMRLMYFFGVSPKTLAKLYANTR